ncbi:unnamed protein product [Lupinus luteus]|uniref:S-protein homolog n=1 Tax=Lupinus luteus TaxID=3873 RepID=A0AAV1X7X8_LUPLU
MFICFVLIFTLKTFKWSQHLITTNIPGHATKIIRSMLDRMRIDMTLMVSEVSGGFVNKTQVLMMNNQSQPLVVRCKDKSHDNGYVALNPGQSYDFKFIPNPFLNRTLWYCTFSWKGANHTFDIYNELRDRCTLCIWELFEANLCKKSPAERSRECFAWDSKLQEQKEDNININTHHALKQQRS